MSKTAENVIELPQKVLVLPNGQAKVIEEPTPQTGLDLADVTATATNIWSDLIENWPEAGILVTHDSDHFAMIHALAEGAANYHAYMQRTMDSLEGLAGDLRSLI